MITVYEGQHVKYFLRGGMVLEGIVQELGSAQVVLRSLTDGSLMIIHHPAEDIMLTKIMLPPEETEAVEVPASPAPEQSEIKIQIKNKLQEALQAEDPELQNMSLEELRQLVREQEVKIIAQKKREHFGSAGNAKMTRYSSPYQPGKLPSWAYGRPPRKGE